MVDQVWHRSRADIAEPNDSGGFGTSVATGDLDQDGDDDLVVGVPSDDISEDPVSGPRAGSIHVLYGTSTGLSTVGNEVVHLDTDGIEGEPSLAANFGWSAASGDFDANGSDDVGIGIPYHDSGGTLDSGAVSVIYGDSAGLTPDGNQLWSRQSPGISGAAEEGHKFGWSLT